MKIKLERIIVFDYNFHVMRRGEPWDIARVTLRKDDHFISFYIKRELLLAPEFKRIFKIHKNKLDKHTEGNI